MKNNRTAVLAACFAAVMLTSCAGSFADYSESVPDVSTDTAQTTVTSAVSALPADSEPQETISFPEPCENTLAAKYFLQGQSDAVRGVYREIYEGLFNFSSVIDITDGVIYSESFGDFLSFVNATSAVPGAMDSNYRMYVDDYGYVTKIELDYSMSRADGARQYYELMDRASEIVSQISDDMSDYDKIKYLHDTIVRGCVYDPDAPNAHSAYGCLVDGRGVCESYSKAFSLLCDKAGIQSVPVLGNATDDDGLVQSHMWNKVCADGVWYNIDCTWDDPTGDLPQDFVQYDYFLICDADISLTHSEDSNGFMYMPSAWDTQGTYFMHEGLTLDYYTDAYAAFSEQAEKCFSGELADNTIRFRCYDDQVYLYALGVLFDEPQDGGYDGITRILHEYMYGGQNVGYTLLKNEKLHIITVRLEI